MKRKLTGITMTLVVAISILFISAPVSETANLRSGPECAECMRAATEFFRSCLEAKNVSICTELFEAERDICRNTVCSVDLK